MTASIELQHAGLRCEIVPQIGGAIAGFWLNGIPVLRCTPTAALNSARRSASFALLPFSNRVAQARLNWEGVNYALTTTPGDEPHAIHGVGWQRPWGVLDAGACHAQLSLVHRPDAAWPFAFEAVQSFELSERGLAMGLSLCNQSDIPVPVGLGWHPYFVKRELSRISFRAGGRWEMGADKLPTHRLPAKGLESDCAALQVDHCFDDWDGSAQLSDELLQTRITSSLDHIVAYTQPHLDFVAIEPVSHVNNAVNLMASADIGANALGLRILPPGETMTATMRIQVAPVTPNRQR